MIVDGVEVLYTMRNGKIVDSNIPTDGLVCYLDTRGKYNTDIYKNTLLDLSGNGNHGTLQNFSFTDGSGYENGGLKFDGVDDSVQLNNAINANNFTIYVKCSERNGGPIFSEEERKPYRIWWLGDLLHVYYSSGFSAVYFQIPTSAKEIILRANNGTADCWIDGVKSTRTYPLIRPNTEDQTLDNGTNKILSIGKNSTANLSGQVDKFAVYNRALTDEEITKLMEV